MDLSLTRTRINAVRHQDCDNLQLLVTNVEDLPEEPAWDVVTLIGVLEYGALFTDDADPFRNISSEESTERGIVKLIKGIHGIRALGL